MAGDALLVAGPKYETLLDTAYVALGVAVSHAGCLDAHRGTLDRMRAELQEMYTEATK